MLVCIAVFSCLTPKKCGNILCIEYELILDCSEPLLRLFYMFFQSIVVSRHFYSFALMYQCIPKDLFLNLKCGKTEFLYIKMLVNLIFVFWNAEKCVFDFKFLNKIFWIPKHRKTEFLYGETIRNCFAF